MPRSSSRGFGRRIVLAMTLGALTATLIGPVAEAATPKNKRASVKSNGAQATDAGSELPDISPNGRFIAFYSESDQLSGKDSNGQTDIYVRDVKQKKTRLISVRTNGAQGNAESGEPVISADGRFVAFETEASTLFKNDKNDAWDVLIRDRKMGTTKLISKSTKGKKGNHGSFSPDITPDGRYVVFESSATNFVAGATNLFTHVYIRDRKKGTTKLISKSTSGQRGDGASREASISANGRFVAYMSESTNLVEGDTNDASDIFLYDRKKKRTKRVSVDSSGQEGANGKNARSAAISADGTIIAFQTSAKLHPNDAGGDDVYWHDRTTKKTRLASIRSNGAGAVGDSRDPAISPDGRYVAFSSDATNLTAISDPDGNSARDVFIHDRTKAKTRRYSQGKSAESDGASSDPSLSAKARFVAFASDAENLVGADSNEDRDVFRRGPLR